MGDPSSDDYYAVLGVPKDATEKDISKAYKREAVKWHPDKNPGDAAAEEKFKKVAEAYDTLNDKDKRAAYDRFGKAGVNGSGMPAGGTAFNSEQADHIFRTFFGGASPFAEAFGGAGGMPGAPFQFGGMHSMPGGASMQFQMGGDSPFFDLGSMGGMPGAGMAGFGGMPPMGGARARRRNRPPAFNEIPLGTGVVIAGLKSDTAKNGQKGTIAAFDPGRERYTVRLSDGDQVSVRPENVHQTLSVVITDMQSAQELNGRTVSVVAYDHDADRYHVRLSEDKFYAIAAGNVIVPDGTRVVITGLESESARIHNGKRAQVLSYDPASGRYEVKLSEATHLRLRRAHVRA